MQDPLCAWKLFVQSLALAAAAQGVLNLVPHGVWKGDQEIANHGLGIIRSFMRPESAYAAMLGHRYDEERQEWRRVEEKRAN